MRMWMIPAGQLCTAHLVGEHGEIHKHRHNFVKRHSIHGRICPVVQIEPLAMKSRHDELAEEINRRTGGHRSPYALPDLSYLPYDERTATVDPAISRNELKKRCPKCSKLMEVEHEIH